MSVRAIRCGSHDPLGKCAPGMLVSGRLAVPSQRNAPTHALRADRRHSRKEAKWPAHGNP